MPTRTDARRPLAAATLIVSAALALGAVPASAATSAEQVYERATHTTPSSLPEIPTAPIREPEATGTIAVSEVNPLPVRIPTLEDPARQAASPSAEGATLPVTGLDVMVFIIASGIAGVLGLALCIAGARRA